MAYPCPQWFANSTVVEGTGTIQPSTPAGILLDDLVLYFVETANQAVAPSGFTAVPNSPIGTGTAGAAGSTALYVFYRWGPGTIPATGDSGDHQFAFAQVWRHVNRADPFGPGQSSVKSSASTSTTIPGVTTDQNNCTILFIASNGIDTATDAQWSSITDSLLGSAQHINENTSLSNGGGMLIWSAELATAGATGDVTATLAASSAEAYLTLTLQPTTIQYVGGQTQGILGTTSATAINFNFTGGLDTVPSAGDIVVVVHGTASTSDQNIGVTSPGDYTEVADLYETDTNDANISVSYKVMGSTPDTSVTVSQTYSTSWGGAVAIHCWRYVDPTTPMDATPVTATGTDSAAANPPSITPATTGAVVLACGAGVSGSLGTYTHPSLGFFRTNTGVDTIDAGAGIGAHQWLSGAFDPAAFGGAVGTGSDSWAAVTLALRPVSTVPQCEPADATHAHAADSSTVIAAASASPSDGAHAHSADAASIAAKAPVSPADTAHGHSAEQPDVTYKIVAEPEDATHGHSAGQSTITAHAVAAPADAGHGHSAEQPSVGAVFHASPADGAHGHIADQAVATAHAVATPGAAEHGHAAESPTATGNVAGAAEPDDAAHAHAADAATITARAVASPSDSGHGHVVAVAAISAKAPVEPLDAGHGQSVDSPVVVALAVASPADALHGHLADSPTATASVPSVAVEPEDAVHGHTASSPAIRRPTPTPGSRIVWPSAPDRSTTPGSSARTGHAAGHSRTGAPGAPDRIATPRRAA